MKQDKDKGEMRSEYDLTGGVRGKYYQRYTEGTNLVLLDRDLSRIFRDSESVNRALRAYLAEHGEPPEPDQKPG
ncbi:MAG: hypothetical protein JO041_10390 [Acidobacteria bacterium]|nr:hypothetical protein [Acidobacteriota bacterium]